MNTKLQMSLLDRLAEGDDSRPTLARIRQAVRRDLECLLNARRSWLPLEQGAGNCRPRCWATACRISR